MSVVVIPEGFDSWRIRHAYPPANVNRPIKCGVALHFSVLIWSKNL